MTANDANTEGMYCPFCGFNPPCGCCMLAVQENDCSLVCAIAINVIKQDSPYVTRYVRNIAKVVK